MNKYEWIQQLSFDEMVKFLVGRDIKLARQMNAELEDGYEKKLKKDLLKQCNFPTGNIIDNILGFVGIVTICLAIWKLIEIIGFLFYHVRIGII